MEIAQVYLVIGRQRTICFHCPVCQSLNCQEADLTRLHCIECGRLLDGTKASVEVLEPNPACTAATVHRA